MTHRKVPFYANTEDNMRCMVACYGSILEYFIHKHYSWDELDELTGYSDMRAAWTIGAIAKMVDMGFQIKSIEPFDYQRYHDIGEPYLDEVFSPTQRDWQLKHSNISEIKSEIPRFLELDSHICRNPTLVDIDDMLGDDMLVTVTLNSKALNEKPGYTSHMILVTGKQGESYIAHDPGLPPVPNRVIAPELLWRAMGEGVEAADVTGFKLK